MREFNISSLYDGIMIVGEAFSGKTTLYRVLAKGGRNTIFGILFGAQEDKGALRPSQLFSVWFEPGLLRPQLGVITIEPRSIHIYLFVSYRLFFTYFYLWRYFS